MRRRLRLVGGAGVAALSIVVAFSAPALAGRSAIALVHRAPLAPRGNAVSGVDTCVSQLDNDSGSAIPSQNFEPEFNLYDAKGADDFTVADPCTVQEVDVGGTYFNGTGPARSVRVIFYQNKAGAPGAVLSLQNGLTYADSRGLGSFSIPLRSPVTLAPGTYWVTVKVNMDYGVGGQWGWGTNVTQRGAQAMWKNGADGFSTGCTRFGRLLTCIPGPEGPDFAFALVR